ncbi:MarR family transcriptional regulator [Streptomyces sp. NPDC006923]|uniref:MarR family winged helix-turn-helix transcriptional regulator n=1 Tax=Streptomyces sp. NPDC006923 TaxID=3155355 RepID=UPI0033E6D0B4
MHDDELDRRALGAWRDFILAYHHITRAMEREMSERAGLTLSQYDVLLRLSESREGRMRMSDLADAIVYSTGGLTRLLERMDKAGLVERLHSAEDRRVVHAVLTDDGRRRLAEASRIHLEGIRHHFTRYLRPEEALPVSEFMHRVHGAARR